jgi:hypothetical protein
MLTEEIIPLLKQRIPTIVGYDVTSSHYTIGEEARQTGLQGKGQTAVFNFKPAFGKGDKEFSAHSALRADFGNIRPFFRGRLVVRLMYRCPV